jgi:fucose 4-O-acetylase-like acetyltransferase
MPLFFFVSGFLSNNISQRRMLDVAKGMAISIAIPYFVWSSIFVLISSTFASSANHPIQLSALAGIVFPWEAVSVYWFLYDLFLAKGAYLLASQLQFNIKSNFLYYALIVFTILYIYFSISVSPGSETIYLPSTSSRLLMACTFFGIGFVLSFKPSVLTAILSKRYIIVFFITWISITFAMLRYSVFGSLDPVAALFGCFSFLSICYNIDRYDNIILRTFSASGKGGYCGFCKPRNCCRFCSHCLG